MRAALTSTDPELGFLWPAADQLQLLDAALLPGDAARAAYASWRRSVRLEEEFSWTVLRLLPLVHDSLARAGERDPLMGRLKGMSRRTWYETQQLFHRTRPAVAALCDADIPVLLLKGAPLVLSYYGHHALRPMSDVDVAVPVGDVQRAISVLRAADWHPTSDPSPDYLRFRHALQMRHPSGAELDLHWHTMYEGLSGSIPDWGWTHAEPLEFLGCRVLQPGPTEMLLQLIVHGVRWNRETPIRWIPDALMVLRARGAEIDWTRLVADARRMQVTLRLRLGLEWLTARYAVALPPEVLAQLRATSPTAAERMEGWVYLRDFRRFTNSVLGNQCTIVADLCRVVHPTSVGRFLRTLPHYLRFRWGLEGRSGIAPAIWRSAMRRLRGDVGELTAAR